MAFSIVEVKEQIVITLYDYMLTSDEEAYWYSISAIREAIAPDISGALARMALKVLNEEDGWVEEGFDDDNKLATFSLNEDGVKAAEKMIEAKGIPLREYAPAPSSDLIISRFEDATKVAQIREAIFDISKELKENNIVGAELGDDKEVLATEIAAAEVLVAKDTFRVRSLIALIVPALRYFSDKFAGSTIGEAAKRLLELLF
jgi:hypothetical protein